MDRTDVVVTLVAVLTIVCMGRPLRNVQFWHIVLLAAVSYPAYNSLLPLLESATGALNPWASNAFLIATGLVFAALGSQAVRGVKSLRDTRADRLRHCHDSDA
ncbi:hypothetical protein ABT025_34950 [Streptomyces sp. NPDC002809]|uniref:hypothetical protein n=1 Tax=Streptomyces sp. NPDC002809 TaxID=3154433 RepID=UPI00331A3F3E